MNLIGKKICDSIAMLVALLFITTLVTVKNVYFVHNLKYVYPYIRSLFGMITQDVI